MAGQQQQHEAAAGCKCCSYIDASSLCCKAHSVHSASYHTTCTSNRMSSSQNLVPHLSASCSQASHCQPAAAALVSLTTTPCAPQNRRQHHTHARAGRQQVRHARHSAKQRAFCNMKHPSNQKQHIPALPVVPHLRAADRQAAASDYKLLNLNV